MHQQQFLKMSAVLARYDYGCVATLDRHVKRKLLPPPVLSSRVRYWHVAELEKIDQARLAGATDEEIKGLVANLVEARQVHAGETSKA